MDSRRHRQLRIVVFDGESTPEVGAWPDLLTFEEMITRLSHDEESELDEIHPSRYFDLIVGTGDGGLLALLFGRLNMTVPQVKSIYQDIYNISRTHASSNERAIRLEQFLRQMIQETTGNANADFETLIKSNSSKGSPSVAVLASTPANTSFPVPLRTYRVRSNNTVNCAIWQAIRAAMASPARFSPIIIAGETYASASQVGHNNPIEFVLSEYRNAFPRSTLGCIISFGSGHPGHNSYNPTDNESLLQHNAQFAADTERHFQSAYRRLADIGKEDVYFRLNVVQGLQLNTLRDDDVLGAVASHVRAYLNHASHNRHLDDALDVLKRLHPDAIAPQPTQNAFWGTSNNNSLLPAMRPRRKHQTGSGGNGTNGGIGGDAGSITSGNVGSTIHFSDDDISMFILLCSGPGDLM
ncbi:acyl transferase/acyl hydrolase/lysophospholipase [Flagelloscypha sp. PMI_526]|nr:acyl transferase/acyl hydrolase/lysophospholipase [Flagelloscypha sp. PMI_526]